MNTFKISYLDGTWKDIPSAVFPLTSSSLLDEKLDETYVTFYNSRKEIYPPADLFRIQRYENGTKVSDDVLAVANDEAAETPFGSGRYKHTVSLMEPTKLLEGIICQTLTFTNDLGKEFTLHPNPVIVEISKSEGTEASVNTDIYSSPISTNNFVVYSASNFSDYISVKKIKGYSDIHSLEIISAKSTVIFSNGNSTTYSSNESPTINPSIPNITIRYSITLKGLRTIHDPEAGELTLQLQDDIVFSYRILVVENRLPLLPYTITDVTNRCLELAEPLNVYQVPRIKFDGVSYPNGLCGPREFAQGSQAEEYSKVYAPELAITQSNLREQLKRIGGYIHAEPRLIITTDESSPPNLTYTVKYDKYGQQKEADLSKGVRVYNEGRQSINDYCTEVRSNVANLVNSLDYAQAVVTEPYGGGYKSLRGDITQRLDENNGIFTTSEPVYNVIRVIAGIKDDADNFIYGPIDISAYVLERASYDLLSSYAKEFPESRSLAIYYTQGQPNIEGLFFRTTTTGAGTPWTEYAIVRVIARELGVSENDVGQAFNDYGGAESVAMQVSYIPMYANLISHSNKYVPGKRFAQIYSQSDNLVETTYFGENIKGTAARMGNPQQTLTYMFRSFSDVPKIGEVIGDYSISAVNTSFLPTYTKATFELTKKFNRINEFVGIDSHKRVYEVSEREAYERHMLLKERVVLSREPVGFVSGYFVSADLVMDILNGHASTSSQKRINCVNFAGYSVKPNGSGGYELTRVGADTILPTVASSYGNAMTFTWSMKDNYSAGIALEYVNNMDIRGWWNQDVQVCDYYGRLEAFSFELRSSTEAQNSNKLPQRTSFGTGGIEIQSPSPIYVDKDSRERLSFTVEIEFLTADDDIIIGSAMAEKNPLINTLMENEPIVYLYAKPIDAFAKTLNDIPSDNPPIGYLRERYSYANGVITFKTLTTVDIHVGYTEAYWVIATLKRGVGSELYENKFGEQVKSKLFTGGDIFLSSTKPARVGEKLHEDIYVTIVTD